jgi:lia operon protein LiaG
MKLWIVRPLVCALSVALLTVLGPQDGQAQEVHSLGGNQVAVFNLAGTVEVVSGSGSEVVVEITRGGADGAQLDVAMDEVGGRQALIVRYPSDRIVYSRMGRGSKTKTRVRGNGAFFGDWGLGRGNEVEVAGSGNGLEAWADLRISVPQGQDFALYLLVGETELRAVDGTVLIDTGSSSVHAESGSGELSIDTGSGGIVVDGFDGELDIDTGSGSVEFMSVRGGDVLVDTGSGSVSGSDISAGSLEVDTGSGEITLVGVSSPDIVLDTGSGEVEVELLSDVDHLEIDTGSGAVTLRVPESVGAEVEMDTGSGGIDLDLPFQVTRMERDNVKGVLGDGVGTIIIDTGSGRIRIIGR